MKFKNGDEVIVINVEELNKNLLGKKFIINHRKTRTFSTGLYCGVEQNDWQIVRLREDWLELNSKLKEVLS